MKKAFPTVAAITSVLALASLASADTKTGPRGQFYVNGKAAIPLGVWQQPEYLFAYHKQLGMNCLVWSPGGRSPRTRPSYVVGAENGADGSGGDVAVHGRGAVGVGDLDGTA